MARRFFVGTLPLLLLWTLGAPLHADETRRYADLVATLAAPDMEGRGPGTAGHDRARDLIAAAFQAAGLRPAFRDRFTQPFTIRLGVKVDDAALQLGNIAARLDTDYTVLGVSGGTGDPFTGDAVFLGYGIAAPEHGYDSFADLPADGLRGKVAVVLRYEPLTAAGRSRFAKGAAWTEHATLAHKARQVQQRGALALLIVNPPTLDRGAALTPAAYSAGVPADLPVFQVSTELLARALQPAGIDDGAAFLREMQRRNDHAPTPPLQLTHVAATGHARLSRPVATAHNVAAVLPGRGPLATQCVVLGAHYDHLGYGEIGSRVPPQRRPVLHPGADDNASGTAGLILAAQRLARWDQRLGAHAPPRRTILFIAFSGEERGLLGALHFLEHLADADLTTDQLTAMVNLDMIGRLRNDTLYAFGDIHGGKLGDTLAAAARGTGLKVIRTDDAPGGSDHAAFQARHIPALHLCTGLHPQYHLPTDTADLINTTGGAAVTDLAAALAWQLAQRSDRLAFNEAEMNPHAGAAGGPPGGGGAYLGVMPDYATLDANDGAALAGVSPGSPAAAAGLRKADRVTKWNDTPIANLRDLTTALRTASPGDTVKLQVQRDGETVTLDVTLGARR